MISLSHLVDYKPMDSKAMNMMEFINDLFVLITAYWFFLFTELIPDVEDRYELGNMYKFVLFTIVSIDGLIVFIMIG